MAEYVTNDEAIAIADTLIPEFHPRLIGMKISHLLNVKQPPKPSKKPKKQPSQGKKITMAKTSKVSAKMQALAEQDIRFVIEYDSLIWDALPEDKKIALVDHELCHCGNDADGCYLVNHSVEEFREILDRRGFWKSDVQQFAETCETVYHSQENSNEQSGN